MNVLVVVPAYNEAKNIVSVIHDLKDHCKEAGNGFQVSIIIINDGSLDDTSPISKSLGVTVIDLPYNLGIGGAVQTGFIFADRDAFDAVVQFDGDGQHMAQEIRKILYPLINEKTDIVIGSRFLGANDYRMPFFRKLGANLFSRVMSTICGIRITDTTSGFRAYGKDAFRLFSEHYPQDYPEVEALILAHKKGLSIKEVPVSMRKRQWGKSSITPLRSVYYMIKVLLAVSIDLLKKY